MNLPARLARLLSPAASLVVLLASLALGSPSAAAEPVNPIGGVRFEPQVQLAGQPLLLNGTGLRAQFIFKGYAAGLYLGQRASNADAVVAQGGAKRLQMRLLIDVPADQFIKAFHQGIERNNPPEVRARLAERAV